MSKKERVTLSGNAPIVEDGAAPGPIDSATGMHADYWVLSEEERSRGFVRPVRLSYKHVGVQPRYPVRDLTPEESERYAAEGYVKYETYPESEHPVVGRFWTQKQLNSGCGGTTTMNRAIAETYARDPSFYGRTYCATCLSHFDVGEIGGEFIWEDGTKVGT